MTDYQTNNRQSTSFLRGTVQNADLMLKTKREK